MRDLSLHILDIVQNSISAQATYIGIYIDEDIEGDILTLKITDNGVGMDAKRIEEVTNPFYTTRTTRKVGFGLALLKASAERSDGYIDIESKVGQGTQVKAVFKIGHIDRPPLGSLDETLVTLIACNPDIDFFYRHRTGKGEFTFDTRDIKKRIEGISIAEPEVLAFIGEYVSEGIQNINGGVV